MTQLLCDENIVGLDALAAFYSLRTVPGRSMTAADLAGVDALWVRSVTQVDRELIADSELRFVGTATAGTEHIDVAALAARDISFCAAPGANANAVVEYVLAALAELGGPWTALDAGATLGIVGYGEVGRRLADVAAALGWRTRVCDPWVAERAGPEKAPGFVALDEVLRADVISLHSSLHRRQPWPSWHLIGAAELQDLDDSQWLLNASRGAVIDNVALRRRLAEPSPPQVVLDVWEGEPDFDGRLLDTAAVVLATPHIAGYSWDSKWLATRMLLEGMRRAGLPTPSTLPAVPEAAPLEAVDGKSAVETARQLLRQRYRISDDDRAFREMAALPDAAKRRGAFDRLRRDYPQRRELRGSVIEKVAAAPACGVLLRALGVLERETGFEPATSTLARLRSTN